MHPSGLVNVDIQDALCFHLWKHCKSSTLNRSKEHTQSAHMSFSLANLQWNIISKRKKLIVLGLLWCGWLLWTFFFFLKFWNNLLGFRYSYSKHSVVLYLLVENSVCSKQCETQNHHILSGWPAKPSVCPRLLCSVNTIQDAFCYVGSSSTKLFFKKSYFAVQKYMEVSWFFLYFICC